MPTALIVDDHDATSSALARLLRGEAFEPTTAPSLEAARTELSRSTPDVVLLDLKLPDGDGTELLEELDPSTGPAVVFITGHASLDTALDALRWGVTDYLTKPVDPARLKTILATITETGGLSQDLAKVRDRHRAEGRFGKLVGTSAPMGQLADQIARVAPTSATVLIAGESGTGKELVAHTIHEYSRRREGPFVPVNCGAISPTIMESELFGHERGSFTGADRRHRGYFERAGRGTLFLDEITEMPIELQVKLLRVLETRSFTRLGGETAISANVRIVAATNRDPGEAVESGKLRSDLYYRLKVFQLELPPLRERIEDVPALAAYFLSEVAAEEGAAKRFSDEALGILRAYGWPGNVRELKNVVYSAYILADGEEITPAALPAEVAPNEQTRGFDGSRLIIPVGVTIAEAERRLIAATLNHVDDNRTKAAELLGISPKTLYNRLTAYKKEREGRPLTSR